MKNENIVIIGMPGCGKTTLGSMLAKQLGMDFVDVDKYIEDKENKSISQIFIKGEAYFREIESRAIKDLSNRENTVISTGGGVVKYHKNIKELKKNGLVIFINRSVDDIAKDIDTTERPLLKDKKELIYTLFNERYELYKKYCDYEIINDKKIEDAIDEIIKYIGFN